MFLRTDFKDLRDELVISTKAGYDMWPGPYGQGGGSRKYVLSSLDQSLGRLGLDYVDIFYSHRFDPETPVEETMQALDTAVRSGRALYAGISSYSPDEDPGGGDDRPRARHAAADPPAVVLDAQPLDREGPARRARGSRGWAASCSAPWPRGCSPTATSTAIPEDSRAARERQHASAATTSTRRPSRTSARLNEIATARGQKLAQLALQWALRDNRVTSAVIGASSVEQLDTNLDALDGPPLTDEELAAIDQDAVDSGINLWAESTEE